MVFYDVAFAVMVDIAPPGGEWGWRYLDSGVLHLCLWRNLRRQDLRGLCFNPFTPKSDQLQFSLSVSHQKRIWQ